MREERRVKREERREKIDKRREKSEERRENKPTIQAANKTSRQREE